MATADRRTISDLIASILLARIVISSSLKVEYLLGLGTENLALFIL